MKRFEFMIRGAITALAAFGALAICPAAQAQSVSVNSAPVCSSAPALTMDPSGNLSITCTPVSAGGGSTQVAPSCTVPSVSLTIAAGATTYPSATIGSACSGNPVPTVQWTNIDGAAGFTNLTGAAVTGGPLGPGAYRFSITATNGVGGAASASGTLTIIAAATGGGGGGGTSGCPTTPVNAVFTGTFGTDNPGINVGSFASYALPQFTAANQSYLNFTAVESNRSISPLPIEYAVSPCVGDFTTTPAVCTKFGTSQSGISMYAFEGATSQTAGAAVCVMQPNTQYYLNVRTVKVDGTNSCPTSTCFLYVQEHLFTY
jgi:hypothetical protein